MSTSTVATTTGPAPAGPGTTRRALRRPATLVAVVFIALVFVACLAAPWIAPYDPLATSPGHALAMPGGSHLLGTDALGRDILSRLLYGGRIGLFGPLEAVAVAGLIGAPLGLVAGFKPGWWDSLFSRSMDVLLAVPGIIVLMTVVSVFGPSTALTMAVLGLMMSPNFMMLVRGETIAVSRELFVDAARASGMPTGRIIRRQILPNVVSPLIVQFSLAFAIALLISAGLGFLGLSEPPPTPSWGAMVSEAAQNYSRDPWMLVPSGGIITLTAVAFNLAGAGLRDAVTERGASSARRRTRRFPTSSASPATRPTVGEDALLTVTDVVVTFDTEGRQVEVLSGVSLEVPRGGAVALVGESGSGKTVTALAALGLLPRNGQVTGGRVVFDGVDLASVDDAALRRLRARRIGVISQDPMLALDPAVTVRSQMLEVIRVRTGASRHAAEARMRELLHDVGLTEATARLYPFQLSGGMAQRVCIAMAISGRPDLLVADEPTTALDVTTQAEILDLLRGLRTAMGMALLLVTHDFGVVADICDRAVVMYAGQVVERAPVEQVFASPRHPYTAALLDSDPHRAPVGQPLPALPGQVPQAGAWLTGCRLADRCPLRAPQCTQGAVALVDLAPERASRCVRIDALVARGGVA